MSRAEDECNRLFKLTPALAHDLGLAMMEDIEIHPEIRMWLASSSSIAVVMGMVLAENATGASLASRPSLNADAIIAQLRAAADLLEERLRLGRTDG